MDDYSKFGREKITHDFSLLNWSPIDDPSVSVNDHFDYLLEKRSKNEASINSEIQKLMFNRDKFFKKMVKIHHQKTHICISI